MASFFEICPICCRVFVVRAKIMSNFCRLGSGAWRLTVNVRGNDGSLTTYGAQPSAITSAAVISRPFHRSKKQVMDTGAAGGDVDQQLTQALRLCLDGDEELGMRGYEACVLTGSRIGFHAHFLDQAGRSAPAAALRRLAVERGCDLALRSGVPGQRPEDLAAEYTTLFAGGLINALMVDRYLQALVDCGRSEIAQSFFPRALICTVRVATPPPEHVAATLLTLEHRFDLIEQRQSVRQMRELRKLEQLDQAPFLELFAQFGAQARSYLADWSASDHPIARMIPTTGHLNAWALIARGKGTTTRHIHPCGWVSGVYYPTALPANTSGGALCIGDWVEHDRGGWDPVRIRPEPGLLVLMPSFYVHWVEPVEGPGPRLSIAFDMEQGNAPGLITNVLNP